MSTPKELQVGIGDDVQFILHEHSSQDLGMIAAHVGQVMGLDAQQLVWDMDFVENGMTGRCVNIVRKPGAEPVWIFRRLREDMSLGDVRMPVPANRDCISFVIMDPGAHSSAG